jgi:hypothetical protein
MISVPGMVWHIILFVHQRRLPVAYIGPRCFQRNHFHFVPGKLYLPYLNCDQIMGDGLPQPFRFHLASSHLYQHHNCNTSILSFFKIKGFSAIGTSIDPKHYKASAWAGFYL